MNINVKVEIPRNLPISQLNNYIDYTVNNMARITLDLTNTQGGANSHFPEDSGELRRASMGLGVVRNGKNSYYLGAKGTVDYAEIVWDYPQSTNWTNPNTYAQWYVKEFKKDKELIIKRAVENAKRGFKL